MVPVILCLFIIDDGKNGNLLCKVTVSEGAGEDALFISQRLRVLIMEKLKCEFTKATTYLKRTGRELFNVLFFKRVYELLNLTNAFYVFCVFLY